MSGNHHKLEFDIMNKLQNKWDQATSNPKQKDWFYAAITTKIVNHGQNTEILAQMIEKIANTKRRGVPDFLVAKLLGNWMKKTNNPHGHSKHSAIQNDLVINLFDVYLEGTGEDLRPIWKRIQDKKVVRSKNRKKNKNPKLSIKIENGNSNICIEITGEMITPAQQKKKWPQETKPKQIQTSE